MNVYDTANVYDLHDHNFVVNLYEKEVSTSTGENTTYKFHSAFVFREVRTGNVYDDGDSHIDDDAGILSLAIIGVATTLITLIMIAMFIKTIWIVFQTTRNLRRQHTRIEFPDSELIDQHFVPRFMKSEDIEWTDDTDERIGRCIVCTANVARVAFMPCAHLCLCNACAVEVDAGDELRGEYKCPVCSDAYEDLVRFFYS
jgi:hypothetical protein